jgi:hypothetical protein
MNYCSIQDAWGQGNYISKQYKKFDENIQKKYIEKPVIKKKIIEKFSKVKIPAKTPLRSNTYCNDFVNHLKSCRRCQIKMREQFRPKILENFEDIIQTNRDIIVLILVGISLMLFFNLLTSATSSNK